MLRRFAAFFIFLLGAHLVGCASAPDKVDALATDLGFSRLILAGEGFEHVAYFAPGTIRSNTLHVYIEGDGTPWITPTTVSADPTPRNPLMLRLMSYDSTPSLYVGRPCYFGFADQAPCNAQMWTMARYSPQVIDSISRAISNFIHDKPFVRLGLFGHSGGGSLAMLLAPRLPQTYAVVTVAGNLDVEGWTRRHSFTPLSASLDPARQPALPAHIIQVHLSGRADSNIPPELIRPVAARQHQAIWRIQDNASHLGPWDTAWMQTLSYLNTSSPQY